MFNVLPIHNPVSAGTPPVYEGNGGMLSTTDGNGGINCDYPETVNEGDILIIQIVATNNDSEFSASGFTLIGQNLGSDYSAGWLWRRATGSESGQIYVNATGSHVDLYVVMSRFSGCMETGTPYEVASVLDSGPMGTSWYYVSGTTITKGTLFCSFANADGDDVVSYAGTGSFSHEYSIPGTVGNDCRLLLDTKAMPSPGYTGTVGYKSAQINRTWGVCKLALIGI